MEINIIRTLNMNFNLASHYKCLNLHQRSTNIMSRTIIRTITFMILPLLTMVSAPLLGQDAQYKIVTAGFYNVENLFDTEDDPLIRDEEFTPDGKRAWTVEKYQEKLANMAYVISQIGKEKNPNGLSFLGLAEVENKKVLEDLVVQSSIKDKNYKIVHIDSPDRRGIDVAMIYNPNHFTPIKADTIPYLIYNKDASRRRTRNILYVKGLLDSDTLHVLVNHWPSRSGGESRSAPFRNQGGKICRSFVDSLSQVNPMSKILIMGDLNDDPNSASIKTHLRAKSRVKDVFEGDVYNPMADFYRRGLGSNAYRDAWSLFDQVILSYGIMDRDQDGYFYYSANVFNKRFLIQQSGRYKGYPFRTFSGDTYQGGYSDHFPVYVHLVKKI